MEKLKRILRKLLRKIKFYLVYVKGNIAMNGKITFKKLDKEYYETLKEWWHSERVKQGKPMQ